MKRLSKVSRLLVALLAAGLIAGAAGGPANAGTLSWTDVPDDASVAADEPNLDILKVDLSSDGTNLELKMGMKALGGSPAASLGYNFQLEFVLGEDSKFAIRITEDPTNKSVRLRAPNGDLVTPQVTCDKCKGEINRKTKVVSAQVPIAALAALSKTAYPKAPPVAAGSQMSALEALAMASYGAIYLIADDSVPPEGTTFAL